MQYVVQKSYLGLAVDEIVQEMGLEKEESRIKAALYKAFIKNYDGLKQKMEVCSHVQGDIVESKESPIGEGDRDQYFRSTLYQTHFNNAKLHQFLKNTTKPFSLMQVYSHNDEIRKKKSIGNRQERTRRKMIKKD